MYAMLRRDCFKIHAVLNRSVIYECSFSSVSGLPKTISHSSGPSRIRHWRKELRERTTVEKHEVRTITTSTAMSAMIISSIR